MGLGWVCLVEAAPPFQFMRPWATPMLQPSFANGLFVSRAKMVTVPELWATPPEVKEKIHLLYQKSEFVEKRMKHFLGRWACRRMGRAPSPALKNRVAWVPWRLLSFLSCLQPLPDLSPSGEPNSNSFSPFRDPALRSGNVQW